MSRHVLPAIALLVTASSVRAQPPAQTPELLTIERAVDMAIEQNRDVRNAALDVERARDQTAVTNTKRWPAMKVNLLESMLLSQIDWGNSSDSPRHAETRSGCGLQ
jgi:outer membrane protein TolC